MLQSLRPSRDVDTLRLLDSIDLFEGFDETDIHGLIDAARIVTLASGDSLFSMRQPATQVHYLETGQLKLFRTSRSGDEKVVALIRPEQVFAEAVMFMEGGASYPVSAAALESSTVWSFEASYVRSIIGASTANCFRLLGRLSKRLHGMIEEIDRLTLHNATFRLVSFLLDRPPGDPAASQDIELGASKSVIASRLSIKPETLSRVLHRLADRGLVEVQGAHIFVPDPKRLREVLDD